MGAAESEPREDVERILADMARGDGTSFGDAFDRYAARLAGLVRRRLGWKLARKIDPDDVVQSVFKSFVGLQQRQEVRCDDSQSLWALLALMATRKCGRKLEYFTAACRDVRVEQSIATGLEAEHDAGVRQFVEAMSREPDPQEAAIMIETVERLLSGLDERDRKITELALEGLSVAEISREVSRSERTIQRVLKRLGEALRAEVPEVAPLEGGSADAR